MYLVILIVFGFFFSVSAYATETEETFICGIPISEMNGVGNNWLGYQELQEENEIFENEALIVEYSSNPYCLTEEYEDKLEDFFDKEMEKFGEGTVVIRKGFQDQCQYLAIVSSENSSFKFYSKFKRRIQTAMVNGELVTWLVHQNQAAIKFIPFKDTYECVQNDI